MRGRPQPFGGSRVPYGSPRGSAGPFQFNPQAGERNAIVWVGASYVFGEQGFPELSTTQPYDNQRAVNNTDNHIPQADALIDLIAIADRESLLEGSTNQLARNWSSLRNWIVHHRAVGGATLGDVQQGSGAYNNQMGQVDDVIDLVDPDTVVYRAFCEEGLGFFDMVINLDPWSTVEAALLELLADYRTDIQSRTGQTFDFPLFLDQYGFWQIGGTPVSPVGALEQLAFALAQPDVFLVGPGYPYNVGGDNIHLTNQGYRAMAEHWGEVLDAVLRRGLTWRPLYATGCSIQPGNIVQLDYHVPALSFGRHGGGANLVLDTSTPAWREAAASGTTHGYRYINGGNPARNITGVLVSGSSIRLQLDGAPASGASIGYADFAAQPPNGPRGNLRDNWTNPNGSESGNPDYLYNWACVQQVVIP